MDSISPSAEPTTARSAVLLIPRGSAHPRRRYYTDWGLYPNQPYIIGPPWSSLVAIDLNSGTIKWKVPLGQDAKAAAEGATNTGVFMAEHHGIITTSTGLLFVATTDGKVRAHDTDTGKVLWTGDLPTGSEGMPAMYEVNGRQFLVVPASSGINSGGGHGGPSSAPPATGQTKVTSPSRCRTKLRSEAVASKLVGEIAVPDRHALFDRHFIECFATGWQVDIARLEAIDFKYIRGDVGIRLVRQ